jgi:hypothetical protein
VSEGRLEAKFADVLNLGFPRFTSRLSFPVSQAREEKGRKKKKKHLPEGRVGRLLYPYSDQDPDAPRRRTFQNLGSLSGFLTLSCTCLISGYM